MFDYAASARTAASLIARFGGPAKLTKPGPTTGPSYDPTPGVATDHPITAVKLDERQRDRTGTLIGETVRTYYISTEGLSVVPDRGDSIDGDQIDEVLPLQPNPNGVIILWEVAVRQ